MEEGVLQRYFVLVDAHEMRLVELLLGDIDVLDEHVKEFEGVLLLVEKGVALVGFQSGD